MVKPVSYPHDLVRVIPTRGIHNFRDYGGYPVASGGHVMQGKLFRSADPGQAVESDLALLKTLNLTAVIDLRGRSERHEASLISTRISVPLIAVDGETASAAPHVNASLRTLNPAQAKERLRRVYACLPFNPALTEILRRYFTVLNESAGATLVCCLAGKDRTGLAVALLHSILGVGQEDILEDYLLTNATGDSAQRIAALARDLELRFQARLDNEAVRVLACVEPEYLLAAFDEIVARYGSVLAYTERVLQVTPTVREMLKARLIV